ncbi:putative 5'(3')-deoxyribonucleotidase [Cedratvirus kamchatka]|uniref:5'(3')-deoxyribonucleotidase n=1 Tax=Cedratvirus kamchatka TaxID=2716914 RepID=A0A6G8MX51_9VIRU|nr:putative 5'(3')-deoxyribonucleotidase [Cedratvirus kamchatka]WIL03983.1 putative 5'(3')-deoxyribonucleotidase [Cedratvirus lena]
MLRVGIDLDGVVFDFNGRMLVEFAKREIYFSSVEEMQRQIPKDNNLILLHRKIRAEKGFFRNLDLLPGALEYISLLRQKYDVYFVSTPELTNPTCCEDKLHGIASTFGSELLCKTIFTNDKTLVRMDVLIDDKEVITGCVEPCFVHIYFTSWNGDVLEAVSRCSVN